MNMAHNEKIFRDICRIFVPFYAQILIVIMIWIMIIRSGWA